MQVFLNIHHCAPPVTLQKPDSCVLYLFVDTVVCYWHVLQICISRKLTCWSWTLPSAPALNMSTHCCFWLPSRHTDSFALNWYKVRIRILLFPMRILSRSVTWLLSQIVISVYEAACVAEFKAFYWWYFQNAHTRFVFMAFLDILIFF